MCERVPRSAVWPGGPKAVKAKIWVLWSNPPFRGVQVGAILPGEVVTTLWLKYFCVCACMYTGVYVCVKQTVFSHAEGQDKDTKNRGNSKWQRGGRAKMEGLVIIKWWNATHTHAQSKVSSSLQRLPEPLTYILYSSVFVAHEKSMTTFVCVCVFV